MNALIVLAMMLAPRHDGRCLTAHGVTHCWEYIGNGDFQPATYEPKERSDFSIRWVYQPPAWGTYTTERRE